MRKSEYNPKSLTFYDGTTAKYFAEDDNGALSDDYLKILSPTKELIKAAEAAGDWTTLPMLFSIVFKDENFFSVETQEWGL